MWKGVEGGVDRHSVGLQPAPGCCVPVSGTRVGRRKQRGGRQAVSRKPRGRGGDQELWNPDERELLLTQSHVRVECQALGEEVTLVEKLKVP